MDTLVYSFDVFKTFFLSTLLLKAAASAKISSQPEQKALYSQRKINMKALNSTISKYNYEQSS